VRSCNAWRGSLTTHGAKRSAWRAHEDPTSTGIPLLLSIVLIGGARAAATVPGSGGSVPIAASPGGGIWRSVNGGATWTFPVNYGRGDYSVVRLEWDAIRPGRLYALGYNGLHASTDRADSWTALIDSGGVPSPLLPNQVAIDWAGYIFQPLPSILLPERTRSAVHAF
jgi:hypothetical protein